MSTTVKKLTNKRLTNIGYATAPSRSRDFLLRKMQQTTFPPGEGRHSRGLRSAQDLRPSSGAAGCAAGAALLGAEGYNETCEELHRRHAQGRIAFAY